jgi:toxin ParE1/3/4
MGVIRRTATSWKDYAAIWDYVAADNPDAADALLRSFDAALRMLSDHPHAGQRRTELRPRLRSFPAGNYLIFYRPLRGGVELVRVLHGTRDVRSIFDR